MIDDLMSRWGMAQGPARERALVRYMTCSTRQCLPPSAETSPSQSNELGLTFLNDQRSAAPSNVSPRRVGSGCAPC